MTPELASRLEQILSEEGCDCEKEHDWPEDATGVACLAQTALSEMHRLQKQRAAWRQQALDTVLEMRDVPRGGACTKCGGMGRRAYGSGATWRGGIGGMVVTRDVCNGCWGSGRKDRPGVNLKRLEKMLTVEQMKELR